MKYRFDEDSREKQWALWRQDDNGNRFLVSLSLTRSGARQDQESYERLGHKQCYWVEPYKG